MADTPDAGHAFPTAAGILPKLRVSHIIKNVLAALLHITLLIQLSLVVALNISVAVTDNARLDKCLCLLQLEVPCLKLGESKPNVLGSQIATVARDDVELLLQLVQLPRDQLVVNAVNDQVLQLPYRFKL